MSNVYVGSEIAFRKSLCDIVNSQLMYNASEFAGFHIA